MATKKATKKNPARIGFVAVWEDFGPGDCNDTLVHETLDAAIEHAQQIADEAYPLESEDGTPIPRVLVGKIVFTHAVHIPQTKIEKL